MTGEDIFLALSEIDDELLVIPTHSVLRVRKGKKSTILLIATIVLLLLCGFGYASKLDMIYENGVLEISVYNPNVVAEYEQWSMGYIADGYEITQVSEIMWYVTNGCKGFYLTQMPLSGDISERTQADYEGAFAEIQLLENPSELTVENISVMQFFYWKSQECMYSVVLLEVDEKDNDELVAMIQSITP